MRWINCSFRGNRPPTDFEILREIWDRYRAEFPNFVKGARNRRSSKIFMPIDTIAVAEHFGVDEDSIFGRLYYHLDMKHGEPEKEAKARKAFFTPNAGSDENCVNFPHLEAVLAGLWQERRRDLLALATATLSLGIALASLFISIFVR